MTNTLRYNDYGELVKGSPKQDRTFGYNGEQYTPQNGLQYLRARHYDATTGTFTSQDSYLGSAKNPISQNRYTYANNDPLNKADPSGHFGILTGLLLGALVVGIAALLTSSSRQPTVTSRPASSAIGAAVAGAVIGVSAVVGGGYIGGRYTDIGSTGSGYVDTFDWAAYYAEQERIRVANLTLRYVNPVELPEALAQSATLTLQEAQKDTFYGYYLRHQLNGVFGGYTALERIRLERAYGLSLSTTCGLGQTTNDGQNQESSTTIKDYESSTPWYLQPPGEDSPLNDSGFMFDTITGLAETGIHGALQYAYVGAMNAVRPANIGLGTFAKAQANEMGRIAGASQNISKIGAAAAVASVAFDVIGGINDNIQNGAEVDRIVSDATVDTVVSGSTALATALVSAKIGAVAGSGAPIVGNLIGAAVGFGIGLLSYFAFDAIEVEEGVTVRDWLKNSFYDTMQATNKFYADNNLKPMWGSAT